jgi:hypothetical protein
MTRFTLSDFARFAATANSARRAPRPAASPPVLGRSRGPSGAPLGAATGRNSLWSLAASVNAMREPTTLANVLTDDERDELTVIAYAQLRSKAQREFAAERVRTLRELGRRVAAMRAPRITYRRIETPSRKARP